MSFLMLNLLLATGRFVLAKRLNHNQQALTVDRDDQSCKQQPRYVDEYVDDVANYCDGDWEYDGNGKCCTSKSVACTYSFPAFCNKPWLFLEDDQCCLTSDSQLRLTVSVGKFMWCEGDWTYMGLENCVTTKPAAQCIRGDKDHCKAPWSYLGSDNCCLTSDSEFRLTAEKGSLRHCNGDWTYLGRAQCVTTRQAAKCVRGDQDHCKAPWSYIGFERCCLTSDSEFRLTNVQGSSEHCKGNWTYLGHGTCVTTKQGAKCETGDYKNCKAPWSYVGSDHCCLTADSLAKMQSSTSVMAVAILSLFFLRSM